MTSSSSETPRWITKRSERDFGPGINFHRCCILIQSPTPEIRDGREIHEFSHPSTNQKFPNFSPNHTSQDPIPLPQLALALSSHLSSLISLSLLSFRVSLSSSLAWGLLVLYSRGRSLSLSLSLFVSRAHTHSLAFFPTSWPSLFFASLSSNIAFSSSTVVGQGLIDDQDDALERRRRRRVDPSRYLPRDIFMSRRGHDAGPHRLSIQTVDDATSWPLATVGISRVSERTTSRSIRTTTTTTTTLCSQSSSSPSP